MNRRSPVTMILLGGGLLLSAIATLIGAYFLGLAFWEFLPDYACYVVYMFWWSVVLGLVLLIPGILGLRACIRRIRALRGGH